VTFHTLYPTDILNTYLAPLSFLYLLVQFLIFLIKCIINKLNLCVPVAIHTPSHGKIVELLNDMHLFNCIMAFSALQLAYLHMLGMAEKYVIRKVIYPVPDNGFIILHSTDDLIDLETSGAGALLDNQLMAIQAYSCRWDAG